MRTTQQFSITLPNEMAEQVRAKVASGDYASESEVIRDGLRTLLEKDRAFEKWLREVGGPAYDAMKANPWLELVKLEGKALLSEAFTQITGGTVATDHSLQAGMDRALEAIRKHNKRLKAVMNSLEADRAKLNRIDSI